ncbi:hypothetical protein EDD17DRAFT_1515391 [Pisolithus thermaeus]|nr:hypothetical protein EDD17DRAFT_1515391 [Pisolithus thermaeus]
MTNLQHIMQLSQHDPFMLIKGICGQTKPSLVSNGIDWLLIVKNKINHVESGVPTGQNVAWDLLDLLSSLLASGMPSGQKNCGGVDYFKGQFTCLPAVASELASTQPSPLFSSQICNLIHPTLVIIIFDISGHHTIVIFISLLCKFCPQLSHFISKLLIWAQTSQTTQSPQNSPAPPVTQPPRFPRYTACPESPDPIYSAFLITSAHIAVGVAVPKKKRLVKILILLMGYNFGFSVAVPTPLPVAVVQPLLNVV